MNDSQWTQAHVFSIHFYFLFLFIDLHVGRVCVCVTHPLQWCWWSEWSVICGCIVRRGAEKFLHFENFRWKIMGLSAFHWNELGYGSDAIEELHEPLKPNQNEIHARFTINTTMRQYNDDKSSNPNRKTSPKLNLCHWQQRWDTNRWTRAWQKRLTNLCVHSRCNAMT